MTGVHYGNDSHKGTYMKIIAHLLVLGSLVPGSKICFTFYILFYIFYIFQQQVSMMLKQHSEYWN